MQCKASIWELVGVHFGELGGMSRRGMSALEVKGGSVMGVPILTASRGTP